MLVLTAGRVWVSALERDGTQLLQALRGPGDLVGEMAMRGEAERTATVVALDACTARYLSVAAFQRFLRVTDAQGALTDYLIAKLSQTVRYQLQLVHFTPRRRVARLLLDLVALGDSLQNPMRIPFSQTGLATALGLARSTVAEQIAALRDVGALAAGPNLIVRDIGALRRVAGDSEGFSDM